LSTLTRFSTINEAAFAWSGRRRSLQERRTAAVGGLAAAEFDDRCDASPRQISTRCAPVVGLVPMARVIASTTTSQRFVAV
jgi:hypothetical protein